MLECLGSILGSTLTPASLGGSGDGLSQPRERPGLSFQLLALVLGPVLAMVSIWGMNQQVGILAVCLSLSFPCNFFFQIDAEKMGEWQ